MSSAADLVKFAVGDRVRANLDIFDASTTTEIVAGALGTVERIKVGGCHPLVGVRWDDGRCMVTMDQNLDRVPS